MTVLDVGNGMKMDISINMMIGTWLMPYLSALQLSGTKKD